MESFVRRYSEYGIKKISIEIAVYPYSNEDGAFSAPGDSGAIVVDSKGSIVGMLVAGAGTTEETDVKRIRMQTAREVARLMKAYPGLGVEEIAAEVSKRAS